MPGKFDNPTTEALYEMTLDGTAETIGEVNDYGHHHSGLGLVKRSELPDEAAEGFPASAWVIISEDHDGFVEASLLDTEGEYTAEMKRLSDEYDTWCETEDE